MILLQRVRQHGNSTKWTALILILMILAKGMNAPDRYLYICGMLLVIGRFSHPFTLLRRPIFRMNGCA